MTKRPLAPYDRFKLDIVCTDGGTHPSRLLARMQWQPPHNNEGVAIWDAKSSAWGMDVDSVSEASRTTREGGQRQVKFGHVGVEANSKGGTTLSFDACPTCGRSQRLRDETVTRYLVATRDTPEIRGRLDVSLTFR